MDSPEKIYEEMERYFGTLPHPDHEPKRTEYYLKLWKHIKSR
jgi:hypothetical protein